MPTIVASQPVSGSVFDIDRFSAAFRLLVEANMIVIGAALYPTLSATYYSPFERWAGRHAQLRAVASLQFAGHH